MTVLVVAEHDNHALKSDTLHAVMAACQISMFSDGQIHVLVAGVQSRAVAEQAVRINGVGKVLVADAQHTDATNHVVAQVVHIAGGYSHILFSAAASDGSAAPGVAAALHVAPVDKVTRVLSPDSFERQHHALMALQAAADLPGPKVLTVCSAAFEAASAQGGIGHIEYLTQGLPLSGIDLESQLSRGWGVALPPGPFAADSHLIRHRANGKPLVGRLSRGGHKPRPRALIG